MTTDFESRVLECTPEESELLLIEPMQNPRGLIELDDGRLLSTNIQGASTSSDGGRTWSETQPLRDVNGDVISGRMLYPQRLKSGAIGGFVIPTRETREGPYSYRIAFSRSEDEGETWSTPVSASEPYNNTVMHGATVTHTGRIVASVYTLIGKTLRQPSRVLFGDDLARVGAHGWEHFFTYCFALLSDDEGATWRTNEGKGKWGGGGELFVTLDFSAGGHWRANEPVVAEVSPGHLLMVLRTPLGRFFQSWSSDNGTTWSHPEPTALAAALTPASLDRIPGTDDLLLIWNQASPDEIERGLSTSTRSSTCADTSSWSVQRCPRQAWTRSSAWSSGAIRGAAPRTTAPTGQMASTSRCWRTTRTRRCCSGSVAPGRWSGAPRGLPARWRRC